MSAFGHGGSQAWPPLPFPEWQDTCATLHMWTQVVGKIRLALAPMVNHWWQVPLYITSTGLTTSLVPYGSRCFQIDFDFCRHALVITTNDELRSEFPFAPYSVAEFYDRTMEVLRNLGIEVRIWTMPVEVVDGVPFELDRQNESYDTDYAHRFWCVLLQTDRVMKEFRSRFIGKISPVLIATTFGTVRLRVDSCFVRCRKVRGKPKLAANLSRVYSTAAGPSVAATKVGDVLLGDALWSAPHSHL